MLICTEEHSSKDHCPKYVKNQFYHEIWIIWRWKSKKKTTRNYQLFV